MVVIFQVVECQIKIVHGPRIGWSFESGGAAAAAVVGVGKRPVGADLGLARGGVTLSEIDR